MSSNAVKASFLRDLNKQELENQLVDLKKNLISLRAKKNSVKSGDIKRVRKAIARALTVSHQRAREAVVEHYKNKKHLPKDLREKKTRALRRALTKEEKNAKTVKAQKKASAFPQRKFAIKA